MDRAELADWLRLALTPGVGATTARKLLAAFGLPGAIFSQSQASLRQIASEAQAAALCASLPQLTARLEETWQWLTAPPMEGIARRILTLADADYPPALLQMPDPPSMLYVMGAQEFALARLERGIAIVGSRNPTPQGEANARNFAKALAAANLTIVSGLALGIDGAAHQGAIDGAGAGHFATLAVVGTGLDRVYPARHRELAHRIARQGLIISEFPLGTPALAANFPKRNRLIAGLSHGTLVVEAALQSGSLITARLAVEQGKEVFAIPGSIHAPQSRGCHALIRQGAKLVETVQDILEELHWPVPDEEDRGSVPAPAPERGDIAAEPTSQHVFLLTALGYDPVSLDALSARTGWSVAQLQAKLLELELEGAVARLPGGLFQRIAFA